MPARASWWWPRRPARVPQAWAAGLLACAGAALFGLSLLVLETGAVGWDESLFHFLNDVPAGLESVLTPLSRLFLPAGIAVVIGLSAVYVVARNRSVLKKSREQFEIRTHKRLLDILDPTQQTLDALMKLDLSAGVDVEIKS